MLILVRKLSGQIIQFHYPDNIRFNDPNVKKTYRNQLDHDEIKINIYVYTDVPIENQFVCYQNDFQIIGHGQYVCTEERH